MRCACSLDLLLTCFIHPFIHSFIHSFTHSFILETYIEPLQETTTQRRSKPSHLPRRTSERFKIWKGEPPEGTAAQRGDHSMLIAGGPTTEKALRCIMVI